MTSIKISRLLEEKDYDFELTLVAGTEVWHTILTLPPQEAREYELLRRRHLIERAPPAARDGLGAELVLWSSTEFSFCELPDSWSSGSSIMPQKKNPDAAELLRAKAPRVVGHLAALHGVMHGLPLTYNKDLQEDKEHLFDAVDTLELTLAAAAGMIAAVAFDRERLQAAAGDELAAATDLADLLVRLGVPFREAHGVVAGLVRTALDTGAGLSELSPQELASHSEILAAHAEEFREVLTQRSWLESKVSEGGTSLARVREQLLAARAELDEGPSA